MIDWHSHLLPCVDDGSRSVDESLQMVTALKKQGATTIIATPHFLANAGSVDEFVNRRQQAYESLAAALPDSSPQILLGAEVKYYPGISRMDELHRLTIGQSNALLIEMPMSRWTEYTLKELAELAGNKGTRVILAHIDRYLSLQPRDLWSRLRESGLLMQVNADFFGGFKKAKALKMLAHGELQFIGSDCHNMTSRPPNIGKAYEVINKKFGNDFVNQMQQFGYSVLGQ